MPIENSTGRNGQITTFYSFKGGVGRTMALANVAFIAAMNGKRVLVMDWDLEAPGLHYYFRGMQDIAATRALRSAPGILDLVWDWSSALQEATSADDVERLLEEHRSGLPYDIVTRSLLPDFDDDPTMGVLHHIGAGATMIATPEQRPYEEALAKFDWSTFFTEQGGGLMLSALRDWAKHNYDLIFLDSRTGFADVAGICTMQIPDRVALCYVYNRQNIDGVAQVAGAIRTRRGKAIELHTVPMRTARQNTSEEADARARARKELCRIGGFTSDDVELDQKKLAIQQAPNVPFYETLALISSDRSRNDQLSLDYLNLANGLLGTTFELPALFEGWVDRVRRRLEPKSAAPDYLIDLRTKEPQRALEEVTHLVESALEEELDPWTEDDYLVGLVGTAIHLMRNGETSFELENLATITLELLRSLSADAPSQWDATLADFLSFYLEQMSSYIEQDEELLLLDEADAILNRLSGTDILLRRLENRRRAARIHVQERHTETATQLLIEINRLTELLEDRVSGEARFTLIATHIDSTMLRGDVQHILNKPDIARRHYESALKVATIDEVRARPELTRLHFDLNSRLARLPASAMKPREAAVYAITALNWTTGQSGYIYHLVDLGEVVLQSGNAALLTDFILRAFRYTDRRQPHLSIHYGRSPRSALKMVAFVHRCFQLLSDALFLERPTRDLLFETLFAVLEMLNRRGVQPIGSSRKELITEVESLLGTLHLIPGIESDAIARLRLITDQLGVRRPRFKE